MFEQDYLMKLLLACNGIHRAKPAAVVRVSDAGEARCVGVVARGTGAGGCECIWNRFA